MPRISTDNYDTVASWNGSQDLFIVEQPDGTKVATPAMVKQYVLAGVTETSEQYAECSTARNVAAKTVTLPGFTLEAGARISVRFKDTGSSNPASGNITLNVNGTGAKEIVDSHTNKTKLTYTSSLFYNNMVNDFIYDGTYWVYMNRDNNTTYSSKTAASGGTATSLCTTGEKYTWNNKQNALTFDNVPTKNSNNPVKSGGIYSKIGDLTQTGLTGDSVAEQLETAAEQLATRTEYFKSSTNGTTQIINIGVAPTENRTFLFACGFHTNYVLELIAMSGAGNITHVPIANSSINSISNISYNANTGDMTITVLNNPFTNGRMTRLS